QWQELYPIDRKISLPSFFARSKASSPQGNQSTGLWACCRRYGLCCWANRFAGRDFAPFPARSSARRDCPRQSAASRPAARKAIRQFMIRSSGVADLAIRFKSPPLGQLLSYGLRRLPVGKKRARVSWAEWITKGTEVCRKGHRRGTSHLAAWR